MGNDRKTRIIKLSDFLKQTHAEIGGGLGLGGGIRTLYRHLSVLYSDERALKNSDVWLKEKVSDETLTAVNRFTKNTIDIPLQSVSPSLRRPSCVDSLDITEKSDFIVTDTFPSVADFFEDAKIMQSFHKNKRSWKDYIKRRQGSVFFARKFDLSAPGTRLISFFSGVPLVPGEFWLMRGLRMESSKILSLWFNSTPNIVQMFLTRTETRGAWMKTDIKSLKENYVLDTRTLTKEEVNGLLEVFDSVANCSFPSIFEQFKTCNPTRKKIDEAVLKTVGFKEKEIDEMLARIYPSMSDEIDKLKVLMEG